MTKSRVRISGLVRMMRWAREQLAAGIPPDQAASFRARVRQTLVQVEAICHEHRIQPQDLPKPSYDAYRFLQEIDLEALPLRETPLVAPRAKTVRITNIVAAQQTMNALCVEWLEDAAQRNALVAGKPVDIEQLSTLFQEHVAEIETLAERQGGAPGDLPTPSRRAYQWLKLLSDPETLLLHLKTLRKVLSEFRKPTCRTRIPKERHDLPVDVEFAYSSHLYRARTLEERRQVTLHQGFMGAPSRVLRALVCEVLCNVKGQELATLKAYSESDTFLEVVMALEMTTDVGSASPRGRYYDLDEVFERVNAAYFSGKLPRPQLTWNQVLTRRKFGHYDALRDTVMVSITLDTADVPAYVVDFIMYHELLHKQLGVNVVNGRRYAHTSDFREAEQRFARYAEAQDFLKSLAKV